MKYFLLIILFLILGYGCVWLFNHVNPWVGLGGGLVYFYVMFKTIKNNLTK